MNDKEWAAVESLLEHGWPGAFDAAAGNAYRVLLADIEPARILAALKVLVQRGGTFRPSAAEIVAAATADPGRPTFDEVFAALFGPLPGHRPILGVRGGEPAALEQADELHPFVGAFVRAQGYDRLRLLEVFDPEYGPLRRRELAEAWARHTEACDERIRTGRALDAAGRAARQIGPRKLDPLGLLGLDRRQLPEGSPR